MALGAGSVTPMQMATAYSVFANGGYRVNPWLISKITDHRGKVLVETQPPLPTEATRAVDARNAFIMDRLLNEVARSGTAASASRILKRTDLYGKTGTTNDSIDTWFNGFHQSLVAIVWMGYDNPRPLGDRETGGSMSLPVWTNFMETALKGIPVSVPTAPSGVVNVGGEWYYDEYAPGSGVSSLGLNTPAGDPVPVTPGGTIGMAPTVPLVPGMPSSPAAPPAPPARPATPAPVDKSLANSDGQPPSRTEERRSLLDLFRN
jgi:penicillin-binding protein 1A